MPRSIASRLRSQSAALVTALTVATGALAEQPVSRDTPLEVQDTIGDLLGHPAFEGFAERVLPWANRSYDLDTGLRNIDSLLPYHSNIVSQEVVDGLNRMIADISAGRRIFFDIYTDAERQARPDQAETGLFFFRGRPDAPFAVIAPGGGFSYVGSVHEGFPYAAAISRLGYNAFVLTYRTGQGGATATRDMARAVTFIFEHAADLDVGKQGYSLWGSSAGARMAASIGSHGAGAFGGDDLPGPTLVVMAYTGHSDRGPNEPPAFVVVGGRDGISPASRMERRVEALRTQGVEVEYRRFEELGHGFGTGAGTAAEGWIDDAVRFWERVTPGAR